MGLINSKNPPGGIRTPDGRIRNLAHKNSNIKYGNMLCENKTAPDTHRDIFFQNPGDNAKEIATLAPSPDLAAIALAWPSIPEPIKVAVKAVLAPYLKPEGGK